jgi:hypothetical protein
MNNEAVFAKHTGLIILGGGLIKHRIFFSLLLFLFFIFVIFYLLFLFLFLDFVTAKTFIDWILDICNANLFRNGADFAVCITEVYILSRLLLQYTKFHDPQNRY